LGLEVEDDNKIGKQLEEIRNAHASLFSFLSQWADFSGGTKRTLAWLDGVSGSRYGKDVDFEDEENDWVSKTVENIDREVESLRNLNVLMIQSQSTFEDRGGSPPKVALRFLVAKLAEYWEGELGNKFSQQFHNKDPVNDAARFVFGVVQLIAPEELPSIRTVMIEIIKQRRTYINPS